MGEYSDAGSDTALGEIFDPDSNTWTSLNKPASFAFIHGDVASCILADGRVLCGSIDGPQTALFDPVANTWVEADLSFGHSGQTKVGNTDEETWTLLPDNTVLTVEVANPNAAEKYLPDQDKWVSAGSTPQPLPLSSFAGVGVEEIGPALLLPNGKLFAIGATGHTALYTPPATETQPGTWSSGPDFPLDASHNILTAIDAPGCLLPNRQALFTSQQNSIAVYTPDLAPNAAWRPVITSSPSVVAPGGAYSLSGRQLNGLSQAVSYGDDYTAATNYPILRLQQGTRVQYCKSYGFSTRGVATGSAVVSTTFNVLPNTPAGVNQLSVVANGIASAPVAVTVAGEVTYWMVPSPIAGPGGTHWSRGADIFTAADVDGDKEVEIVVANNSNGWTGVLKWVGSALEPVWLTASPIPGPGGTHWSRGADTFTAADVDGDGKVEIVIANNSNGWTGVLKWVGSTLEPVWLVASPIPGPGGTHWSRGADTFTAADVDGDGKVEIIIANNSNGWTGVLKWVGSTLEPVWLTASPIPGPGGTHWSRGADVFTAADVDGDGKAEILISNNSNGWTGVLKWTGSALEPVWLTASPIPGPGGTHWSRGDDSFVAADVDGDGKVEIVVSNNGNGWTGVLKWNGSAMVPIWLVASPIYGPAGHWSRGSDTLIAGDVDGDQRVEIVIANDTNGWTGVLKWNGSGLAPVWENPSPVTGPAGSWSRGPDLFVSADVNADGHVETLIANNSNGWTGLLRWVP
jgi:hypothetical protein